MKPVSMTEMDKFRVAAVFGAAVMSTGCGVAQKTAVVPASSAIWNSSAGIPGNLAEGTLETAADAQKAKYTVVNKLQSLAKTYPELAGEFSGIVADYQRTGKIDKATISAVTSKVKGVDQNILKDISKNYATEAVSSAGAHLRKFARLELDTIQNAVQLRKGATFAGIHAVENNLEAYGCDGVIVDGNWEAPIEDKYLEAFRRENLSAKIPTDWKPISFVVAGKILEITRVSGINDDGLCDVGAVQGNSFASSSPQSLGRTISEQQSIDLTTALNNAGCDWLKVSSAPYRENEAARAAVYSVAYENYSSFNEKFGNSAPSIGELTEFISNVGSKQCIQPTPANSHLFNPK